MTSYSNAPANYPTDEYTFRKNSIKTIQSEMTALHATKKGLSSYQAKKVNAQLDSRGQLLSHHTAILNTLPAPELSASYHAGKCIEAIARAGEHAAERFDEMKQKLAETQNYQHFLTWSMEDLVAAQVEWVFWERATKYIGHVEGELTLEKVIAVWEAIVGETTRTVMNRISRLTSRSTSTLSNVAEDIEIQTLSKLIDETGFNYPYAFRLAKDSHMTFKRDEETFSVTNPWKAE